MTINEIAKDIDLKRLQVVEALRLLFQRNYVSKLPSPQNKLYHANTKYIYSLRSPELAERTLIKREAI